MKNQLRGLGKTVVPGSAGRRQASVGSSSTALHSQLLWKQVSGVLVHKSNRAVELVDCPEMGQAAAQLRTWRVAGRRYFRGAVQGCLWKLAYAQYGLLVVFIFFNIFCILSRASSVNITEK